MGKKNHKLVSLIKIYVPPLLEHALGCTGEGRYIAYWVHVDDGLCWTDGTHAGSCDGLDVWCDYSADPRVEPFLAPYDFGADSGPAVHWLVLDRRERTLRVGGVEAAARFMRAHRAPVSSRRMVRSRRGSR